MLQSTPHIRLAISGDDLIVLDLATDRYLGLPDVVLRDGVAVSIAGNDVRLHPEVADGLAGLGFLERSDRTPPSTIATPTRSVRSGFELRAVSISPSDVIDLIIAGLVTAWRLKRGRPCSRHVAERGEGTARCDGVVLRGHLARFDLLRILVPTPRRCLPAALLLSLWLERKGIATEIVFGVRTHPFEAHCWTEHGGAVVDDEIDRIRSFTPISIGLL